MCISERVILISFPRCDRILSKSLSISDFQKALPQNARPRTCGAGIGRITESLPIVQPKLGCSRHGFRLLYVVPSLQLSNAESQTDFVNINEIHPSARCYYQTFTFDRVRLRAIEWSPRVSGSTGVACKLCEVLLENNRCNG